MTGRLPWRTVSGRGAGTRGSPSGSAPASWPLTEPTVCTIILGPPSGVGTAFIASMAPATDGSAGPSSPSPPPFTVSGPASPSAPVDTFWPLPLAGPSVAPPPSGSGAAEDSPVPSEAGAASAAARRSATAGDSMLSTTDVLRGLSAGAGSASPDASGASAGFSTGARFPRCRRPRRRYRTPRSPAWSRRGRRRAPWRRYRPARRRPRTPPPSPWQGPPSCTWSGPRPRRCRASGVRRRGCGPSGCATTACRRSAGRASRSRCRAARRWLRSSGRAPCSKASWPFTVRATAAANSFSLSARGIALSAAKQAASSSPSIHSNGRCDQSASIASPGLQAAKSSSFVRVVGRSAVSLKAMSSACEEPM